MQTTEIFVDQVLIGFMVVAAASLPFLPELTATFGQPDSVTFQIATGAVMVAAAYLLGTVCDRIADTFVDDLDRHHRARFALKLLLKRPKADGENHFPLPWQDPYPEDRLRVAALKCDGAVAEQLQYLRTRIRLARSIAVLLPAVVIAVILGLGRLSDASAAVRQTGWLESFLAERSLWWLVMLAGAYPAALLISWIFRSCLAVKAPRTDDGELATYGTMRGFDPTRPSKPRQMATLIEDVLFSRLLWLDLLMLILGTCLFLNHPGKAFPIILLIGFAVATASAAAWWRISSTFMEFLLSIQECEGKGGGACGTVRA